MLLPLIDLVIVFHCLVFGIFFLIRKGGIGRTNIYLGILLLLLAFMSLPFAIRPTGWIVELPYLVNTDWPAGFLFAPFYLWFIRELTGEKIKFNIKEWLLVVPGIISFLYFSKFYFQSPQEQVKYLQLIQHTYIEDYQIWDAIFYPYIQGYFIYCIILLYRRQKKVSGIFLDNLRWLKIFTMVILGFGFFGAAVFFLHLPQPVMDSIPLCSACIYMVMIYRFLQQSGKSFDVSGQQDSKPKYSGSNLEIGEVELINSQLQRIMVQDKIFLNSELTLKSLAQKIKTTPHHLSQIINQYHQKNFSDFVNTFRIDEAKRKILEDDQLKLEAIGYECGFNTKTTFNATFKKVTGLTPSEYRKKHSEKDVQIYNN